MKIKFKIKYLLALVLIAAVAVAIQSRLALAISTFSREVADPESNLHHDLVSQIRDEFPAIHDAKISTFVDGVDINSDVSLLDYCLFRRTIDCRYNYNVAYLRRETAHGKIPPDIRVGEQEVDVPSQYQKQQAVRVSATPFGYKIEKK